MKKYPPRTHTKANRLNKADWPKWLLHTCKTKNRVRIQRPIKNMLIYPV